jgi:ABC-type histidine transport system ATPase subunit
MIGQEHDAPLHQLARAAESGTVEEEGHRDAVFGNTRSERLRQFPSGNLK